MAGTNSTIPFKVTHRHSEARHSDASSFRLAALLITLSLTLTARGSHVAGMPVRPDATLPPSSNASLISPSSNATSRSPSVKTCSENDAVLQTAVNSVNLVLVVPVNSYVVWLILSGAGGTIASEFFFLNLSVSGIISSLVGSVFYFALLHTSNCIFKDVYVFSIFSFLSSVPSLQCCFCVERYIAVVHPVVFLRYKALQYRVGCCAVVWLMGLAPSLLTYWSRTWAGYILLGLDFVCICVVSFCCLSVLRALKQPGPGEGQQRDSGVGNDMKSRAFRIILITLVVMLLTMICGIIHMLSALRLFSTVVIYITYGIVMMSVLVHPLLYIHKTGKPPCFRGP